MSIFSAYDQSQQYRLGKAAEPRVGEKENSKAKAFVEQVGLLKTIENRLSYFQAAQLERRMHLMTNKDLKAIDALAHDPHCNELPALIEVSEKGSLLTSSEEHQQAKAYFKAQNNLPKAWQRYIDTGRGAPYKLHDSSYIHQFTSANTSAAESIVVAYDLYRPPWKPYFASDVFLHQWNKAMQFSANPTKAVNISLQELPSTFPSTFYMNNVIHEKTLKVMSTLLDHAKTNTYMMPCKGHNWDLLCATPHLRYLQHVLGAYNQLNRQRGNGWSRCNAVQLYRSGGVYHLKFFVEGER